MAITVAALEERVNNHIKYFNRAVAAGFGWLVVLSILLYNIHSDVKGIATAQADAPAKIVAKLLGQPQTSSSVLASNLNAVSAILQTSKIGSVRPSVASLTEISSKLSEVQDKQPNLPSVWEATGAYINYKSDALLPVSSTTPVIAKGVRCYQTLDTTDRLVFSNCELTLEELAQQIRNLDTKGGPTPFLFVHCIVHYGGGAIPARRLSFIDCVFRFQVQTVPPPEGILAMRQLTTAPYYQEISIAVG